MVGSIGDRSWTTTQALVTAQREPAPAQAAPAQGTRDRLGEIAGQIGVSREDLVAQLGQGSSLREIAEANGVSQDDLVAGFFTGGLAVDTYAY